MPLAAAFDGRAILVTGGAGFIGSRVARCLSSTAPGAQVIAMDNLRRRGAELNLDALAAGHVAFCHGDVRVADDFPQPRTPLALIVDCSADPSVQAGVRGGSRFVVDTNLVGTVNCLELARQHRADLVFLSTSRVYPVEPLNEIAVEETPTRFALSERQVLKGVSTEGVSETFDLGGVRSLYGATKLASELLIAEYSALYGLRFVINRCGVVTGPGQFGKADQGVFALWMAKHFFGEAVTYQGWGGMGKQLRDLLHVNDLCDLLAAQLSQWDRVAGRTYNVGGGSAVSLSLRECTDLCREITGREVPIRSDLETSPLDVRAYVTDASRVTSDTGWRPRMSARETLRQIHLWLQDDADRLRQVFHT
jgi:CDP-paratose 2-epimerase